MAKTISEDSIICGAKAVLVAAPARRHIAYSNLRRIIIRAMSRRLKFEKIVAAINEAGLGDDIVLKQDLKQLQRCYY